MKTKIYVVSITTKRGSTRKIAMPSNVYENFRKKVAFQKFDNDGNPEFKNMKHWKRLQEDIPYIEWDSEVDKILNNYR